MKIVKVAYMTKEHGMFYRWCNNEVEARLSLAFNLQHGLAVPSPMNSITPMDVPLRKGEFLAWLNENFNHE